MTDKLAEIDDRARIIYMIEGYAMSARRTFDRGKDPKKTLGFLKSQLRRYDELTKSR